MIIGTAVSAGGLKLPAVFFSRNNGTSGADGTCFATRTDLLRRPGRAALQPPVSVLAAPPMAEPSVSSQVEHSPWSTTLRINRTDSGSASGELAAEYRRGFIAGRISSSRSNGIVHEGHLFSGKDGMYRVRTCSVHGLIIIMIL